MNLETKSMRLKKEVEAEVEEVVSRRIISVGEDSTENGNPW